MNRNLLIHIVFYLQKFYFHNWHIKQYYKCLHALLITCTLLLINCLCFPKDILLCHPNRHSKWFPCIFHYKLSDLFRHSGVTLLSLICFQWKFVIDGYQIGIILDLNQWKHYFHDLWLGWIVRRLGIGDESFLWKTESWYPTYGSYYLKKM